MTTTIHRMRYLATAIMLLSVATAFAQGTTEEELRYIAGGYEIQVANGLDMKKGYTFKPWHGGMTEDGWTIENKALYRTGATSPCAIMMIVKSPSKTYYVPVCNKATGEGSTNPTWHVIRRIIGNDPDQDHSRAVMYHALVALAQP